MSWPISKHDLCILAVLAALSALLWLLPGPKALAAQHGFRARAEVLTVDDSLVETHNLVRFGSQRLTVEILDGPLKGRQFPAANELRAQLELDKLFRPGDTAVVVIDKADPEPDDTLIAQDHSRIGWTIVLFALFCLLLCVFGGWTGFKALLSFVFSCLVIWKAVIPLTLRGWPASWTIFASTAFLTAAIMYLVAGANRRGATAFLGATLGVLVGLLTAHLFTRLLKINGATLPYAQTLLFSGYESLDLADIFIGAMILASSGAVMDLAMDIATGIEEVSRHNPALSRLELCRSGLRIGRSVVGTMTTTLLLAYSGGYITLLMMFCAQGSSPWHFINNPLVAAESVKTLIGSFALVLVAPFTALLGAAMFHHRPPAAETPAAPKTGRHGTTDSTQLP